MAIIVNGTSYPAWDDVPESLRIAIANSGTAEPEAAADAAPEVDELDELVRLAEAAEARRAGIEPEAPPPPPSPPPPPAVAAPTFELNGHVYRSIDEVPGEIREALRLQLLGPPAPTIQPRIPAALGGMGGPGALSPPVPGGVSVPPSMGGTGPATEVEPYTRALLSTKTKVAIVVMMAIIVAIYLAILSIG
jgi:hypothetical protein